MKTSTAPPTITPRTFAFLRDLALHNDRPWFEANKDRYLLEVRDPLLRFVAAFGPRLAKLSANMVPDPRPVGVSLFRIYRDTRFSKDKTPYKTHAGIVVPPRRRPGRARPGVLSAPPAGNGLLGRWHLAPAAGDSGAGARRDRGSSRALAAGDPGVPAI
jgi:uncharacterized protein (TIGR02453 family)